MISKSNVPTAQIALVAGLVATVALFRVLRATMLPELPNFSPVMAMALCGGLFLPGLLAWLLPIAIIVLSDLALNRSLGYPLLSAGQLAAWACLLIAVAFGRLLAGREKLRARTLAGVLIVNALIFYAMTNGVAWMLEPLYPRSVAGLVQALTTGLPGYPPTWQFFRNALVSDFLFVGLIFAIRHFALRTSRDPVGSAPRRLPG